ncbi:hypothetical protein D3C72_873800 [compost metagenome]
MLIQTPAGYDKFADALITAERCLNGVLRRNVSTQAHRGEHFQPFDIAFGVFFRAVQNHPALTETGNAVGFRQAVKGDGQQIRSQRSNRVVLRRIVQNLVVNLIGKDNQVVLTGDLNDLHQQLFGIDGTRWVVRVDNHNTARARGDFGADIVEIREPVGRFIAQIVHRFAAGKGNGRCPQRIVRRRHQHFIAAVKQSLHRLDDQFRNAVTNIDIFNGDIAHPTGLIVLHDGLTGGIESF